MRSHLQGGAEELNERHGPGLPTRIWSLREGKEVLGYNGPFNELLQKHSEDTAIRRR